MKFMTFLAVIAALLAGISAAEHGNRGRIFNGCSAFPGQFKFMAALAIKKSRFFGFFSTKFHCGGSIIGPKWVLTAAHCLDGMSTVRICLGSLTADDAEVAYVVERHEIVLHPNWDAEHKVNDIALIRIPKTLECHYIAFARLPFQWIGRQNMLTNMRSIAMGWGQIVKDGPFSKRLKWTKMTIVSNDNCRKFCTDLTENDLCAEKGRSCGYPSMGDSGGPLVLKDTNEIIGITSLVPVDKSADFRPVIFTRVSNYLPWIIEVTGISS